jgi:hypothetical protein
MYDRSDLHVEVSDVNVNKLLEAISRSHDSEPVS